MAVAAANRAAGRPAAFADWTTCSSTVAKDSIKNPATAAANEAAAAAVADWTTCLLEHRRQG